MDVVRFSAGDYLRGSEAFHYARKSLEVRFPNRAHDHDCFEVFLIERGGALHWINGEMQRLAQGHLAFIRPRDAHAFRADRETGCRIVNVMFRAETAEHLVSRYPREFRGRLLDWRGDLPEAYELMGSRFERAVNVAHELGTSIRSLARVEEFLLTLTNRVVERSAHPNSTTPRWFSAACEAVRDPAVFRGGAAAFVRVAGRSHEHVCRVTRAELGVTPSGLVNRVRIEHAAFLLGHGELPVPEVARACGIENLSHFHRLFRTRYGVTPRQYRLRNRRAPF